jgi:hypothetical protein
MFNKKTSRKSNYMGVCTRRINCGSWSEDELALGSEDFRIVIISAEGQVKKSFTMSAPITQLEFGDIMSGIQKTGAEKKDRSLIAVDSSQNIRLYAELMEEYAIEISQNFGKIQAVQFATCFSLVVTCFIYFSSFCCVFFLMKSKVGTGMAISF